MTEILLINQSMTCYTHLMLKVDIYILVKKISIA